MTGRREVTSTLPVYFTVLKSACKASLTEKVSRNRNQEDIASKAHGDMHARLHKKMHLTKPGM